MNNKTIQQIASLVMALVMILGNISHTQAAPAAQTTGPSIYWGAMVNGSVPSSTNLSGAFATFETRSKKKMSIIHWGQPWKMQDGTWGEFQTSYFENVRNHGSIPMINWASQKLGAGINQSDFQLRDIYGGSYDTFIRRWATDARNWGHPLFLRFDHEMNGWWYPWGEGKTSTGAIVNGNSAGDFVKAWRHVHDIFVSVGATNVTWVWAPNHIGNSSNYPSLSTLYPGDSYVDWTGFSAYNKYSTWAGLNPLLTGSEGITWMKNSYNIMLTVAPNKPMMLAEFASVEAGDGGTKKAAWIKDALTTQIPINLPKIKAVVWMNWDINTGKTYPIESSLAATSAWATGIGSTVYASNQYANLNTSPIPTLAGSQIAASPTVIASPTRMLPTNTASPTALPPTITASPTRVLPTVTASPTAVPPTFTASPTRVVPTITASPTAVPPTFTASPTSVLPTITASPTLAAPTLGVSPTAVPSTIIVSQTATLSAIADSCIDGANPSSTASGTSASLYVNASPVHKTFLKFDLTSLAGKTISTVTLRFKTTADASAGSVNSLNVKLVNDVLWKEQYMSYNNTVPISTTLLGTVPANSAPNTWYEITLTSSAIQPKLGGLFSVAIESTGQDGLLLFSRESTDQPQLIITYQ